MAIFRDIGLSWKGDAFTIPASRVLGAIAIVEDHITFPELLLAMQSGKPPLAVIARAYGGVLRYAGARVTNDETYAGMFDAARQEQVITAINALLVMMVPPDALAKANRITGGEAPAPGNSRTAAPKLSRHSSKRRSAAAG